MPPLKVAIIGGGAAAAGILHGLELSPARCEITLFHPDRPFDPPLPSTTTDDAQRSADYFADVYRHLRRAYGITFPPPKTHFGLSPLKRSTNGGASLWEAPVLGGLTNFWGAMAVPFTERELGGWPVSVAEPG